MIPASESTKSAELLDKFRYQEMDGIYILGCLAPLLYIHAQQQRAFNLAWALRKERKIWEGCEVAIVGGGIAGVSAAIALAASKTKVTLFERMYRTMTFQRGNLTRFVHPNVARWPDAGSGYPITHMPIMNWRAGTVDTVNRELEQQWDAAREVLRKKGAVEVLAEQDVTKAEWRADKKKVCLQANGKEYCFDIAVLAVGYGIELSKHGTSSYWHNDDFAQPVLGPEKEKKYLVSGIGDGALTEVLRLRLSDFQHHEFIESVIFDDKLKKAGDKAKQKDWNLWTKQNDELKKEFASFFYHDPANQKKSKMRQDTKVVLIGSETEPHVDRKEPKNSAQILHRVCVKLLRDAGELEYRPGRLADFENSPDFKDFTVVQRHGSDKALVKLLGLTGEDDPRYRKLSEKSKVDDQIDPKTYEPQYGRGYLADELMESHFEQRYEIGIKLGGSKTEHDKTIQAILTKAQAKNKGVEVSKHSEAQFECEEGKFTLKIEPINSILYAVPQDAALLTRYHVPVCYENGLILRTDRKSILDKVFDDENLPYHMYRVYLAENFPHGDPRRAIDQFVNTDTWVYLLDQRKKGNYLEVICDEGMHQAHSLLRVPLLIDVMGNNWPTKSVHGLGWAVKNTSKTNIATQRGNELLQRAVT